MTFGVSALACRLDVGVDWTDLTTWAGVSPAFAGKYFIGSPWRWVHGEGTARVDPAVPGASLAVVPIQASDPVRQAEPGDLGQQWGKEDGTALADAVEAALLVGDLAFGGATTDVYVYLEVAGTALGPDYWAAWAAAVSNAYMVGNQPGSMVPRMSQNLRPCLATTFAASAAGLQAPQKIRDALDGSAKVSWGSARCHGFWARTDPATIAPAPPLDWSGFAAYSQKQRSGPDVPVPVKIWRYATGDPTAPVHQVGKVTLEATQAASGQPDPVLDAMLTAQAWAASARPSMIGVDRAAPLSKEIGCLSTKELTVGNLPEKNDDNNVGPALAPALSVPAKFAGRYYSAGQQGDGRPPTRIRKDLTRVEAGDLASAGVDIVPLWEARVTYMNIPATLPGTGSADGYAAGWFAATQARQPVHTPIYFSIDCDVTETGRPPAPPFDSGAITKAQLIDYFAGVRQGLAAYLAAQPKAQRVPYAVGVYSCAYAFDLLYPLGLASHFWQANPWTWGGGLSNKAAWPRANLWQVGMDRIASVQADSHLLECKKVFTWILYYNDQPPPAQIQVTVGPKVTTLAFPPPKADLEGATGAHVSITKPQAGVTAFVMDFNGAPVGLSIQPVGVPPVGFAMDLREEPGVADLNVSWGDPGGWRAPRGGA